MCKQGTTLAAGEKLVVVPCLWVMTEGRTSVGYGGTGAKEMRLMRELPVSFICFISFARSVSSD
jgi:hypothetical protein